MDLAGHDVQATQQMLCRVCGARTFAPRFRLREMYFGTREMFDYFQCLACGCIEIVDIPHDIGRHYPSDYYSYAQPDWIPGRMSPAKSGAKAARLDVFLALKRGWRRLPFPAAPDIKDEVLQGLIGKAYPRSRDRILDIGCGRGERLLKWRYAGFTALTGFEPFIDAAIDYGNGVRILTDWKSIGDDAFDFVMLNHALEHMPDQIEAMTKANRCLKLGRVALVRVPCCSSAAWETYGVDWYALDPPRHFYIHSIDSLHLLAARTGFEVIATEWDSTSQQFWASEQYRRDISLMDERSYGKDQSVFTAEAMARWQRETDRLNAQGRGDCIVLHLRKVRTVRPNS